MSERRERGHALAVNFNRARDDARRIAADDAKHGGRVSDVADRHLFREDQLIETRRQIGRLSRCGFNEQVARGHQDAQHRDHPSLRREVGRVDA